MKEISLQAALNHPHIVGVQGIVAASIASERGEFKLVRDDSRFLMIAEYCERGSLHQWLSECRSGDRPYDASEALRLLVEVALGMEFLHSRDMIHMDLKPDNIMINADMRAKVGDFGLAAKLEQKTASQLRSAGTLMGKFEGGTLDYIAPECFAEKITTRKSDVYAYGIVLHNVFVSLDEHSTYNHQEILGRNGSIHNFLALFGEAVRRGMRPQFHAHPAVVLSADVRDGVYALMQQCWHEDRSKRPTFEEIVKTLRGLSALANTSERARPVERPLMHVSSSESQLGTQSRGSSSQKMVNSRKFLEIVRDMFGIDRDTPLKNTVDIVIAQLGIEDECAGIRSLTDKVKFIASSLGILDECV